MHGGIEREYLMHVPPTYNGSPMPVVIYFHGGGGSIDDSKNQGSTTIPTNWGSSC